MTTNITMQSAITFVTDSMTNAAMLLSVVKGNAVASESPQIIDAYATVVDNIDWVIDSLNTIKEFVSRIPSIAAATTNSNVLKAYANILREHYEPESICQFVHVYSETLNWDDNEYDTFGNIIDAISVIDPEGCQDLQAAMCMICRFMVNYYDRQKVEKIGLTPDHPHQVSLGYLLDNIGYLWKNADIDGITKR